MPVKHYCRICTKRIRRGLGCAFCGRPICYDCRCDCPQVQEIKKREAGCQSHACDSFEQDERDPYADRCFKCGRPSNEHSDLCPECGAAEGQIHDTDCCHRPHQS